MHTVRFTFRFIECFLTLRFLPAACGMVMGWVVMFFWFSWDVQLLVPLFEFSRSCFISLHGKPQNSFRNGKIFKIFQIFRIFQNLDFLRISKNFRFSEIQILRIFRNFQIFKVIQFSDPFQRSLVLHDFPSPSIQLWPRNTLAAAGSL